MNFQRLFKCIFHPLNAVICLILIPSCAHSQVKIKPSQLKWLDDAMSQSTQEFNLPSMSVAIVHKGQTIWSKSYGETVAESGQLSTPETLYAVASNTKAFTAAAIAQLVDKGQLDWNDRVQQHIPWFELYDPYVSAELRIRDLLCHRSGLATFSGDLLWYGTTWTSREILKKVSTLEPVSSFRTQFGYQNLMFLAAGEIIEVVSGQPWKNYIEEQLLHPIEMTSSVLSTHDIVELENVAAPHNELPSGTLNPIAWVNWDNIGPAGSLISSAEEMAQWMIVQLDSGKTKKDTLWTSDQTREMWTMHTPIPVSSWYEQMLPSLHYRGYGLGWELYDLHGRKVVAHSGGYDGMISRQVLVPEEKLGVIILTNTNTSVPWGWGHDVLNVLLNGEKSTPILDFLQEAKRNEPIESAKKEAQLLADRIPQAPPSRALSDYAGTYTDPVYGDVNVFADADGLRFQFEPTALFQGTLEPWHFDTFRLHWKTEMMLPSGMAHFTLDMRGAVESLDFNVPNPDFDFSELHFVKGSME
jgi:CubicO group peptidase (beta-lactamase class C family)